MPIARGLKRKNKGLVKKKTKGVKDLPKQKKLRRDDEEISSSDDDLSGDGGHYSEHSEDEYDEPKISVQEQAQKLLDDLTKAPAQAEESESHSEDDDVEIDTIARPIKKSDQLKEEISHKKVADLVYIDDDSVFQYRPHRFSPICVAVSSEGKFLVSCSKDGTVVKYEMGFVDTMYGHQDAIPQLDMLTRNRVLSCGGQDRTVRLFKIAEESHLVFNGYADAISIDTIAMINEDHFVSGSIDGSIYVWSAFKKKPVYVEKLAHGRNETTNEVNWISSLAASKYTDLIASGSCDGVLRLWKVAADYKSLEIVEEYEIEGFINDIRFAEGGQKLICAVGQEHKNGRWWKIDEAKNAIVVLPLKYRSL